MKKLNLHFINLFKYSGVGLCVSLLNIFFSWIFIDIVGIKAIVSSTIIGVSIFFIKYLSYTKINLIHKKFYVFLIINLTSVILYIILTSILIDIFEIKTLIAVPLVVVSLFILRFLFFYWTKIIKN